MTFNKAMCTAALGALVLTSSFAQDPFLRRQIGSQLGVPKSGAVAAAANVTAEQLSGLWFQPSFFSFDGGFNTMLGLKYRNETESGAGSFSLFGAWGVTNLSGFDENFDDFTVGASYQLTGNNPLAITLYGLFNTIEDADNDFYSVAANFAYIRACHSGVNIFDATLRYENNGDENLPNNDGFLGDVGYTYMPNGNSAVGFNYTFKNDIGQLEEEDTWNMFVRLMRNEGRPFWLEFNIAKNTVFGASAGFKF